MCEAKLSKRYIYGYGYGYGYGNGYGYGYGLSLSDESEREKQSAKADCKESVPAVRHAPAPWDDSFFRAACLDFGHLISYICFQKTVCGPA